MNERILVVEDEPPLLKMVADYLTKLGFSVVTASTGPEALSVFSQSNPSLVVLDIQLPGMDGLDVAQRLLKQRQVPIIFVTARNEESDRILGLELGADDYVVKPYSLRELVARIKAVLRRSRNEEPAGGGSGPKTDAKGIFRVGSLVVDPDRRIVTVDATVVSVTAVQFELLLHLVQHPGRVFSRAQLLEAVMDSTFAGYERTVDAHIKNLRKALGDEAENPRFIETLRGVGYRLKEDTP